MHVILLATGERAKLGPLTAGRPSPLLPVANRPVMAYALELLARQGFRRITVSLYRYPHQIEAWAGQGQRWGLDLEYTLQQEAWGTAGAVRWAAPRLAETCLVLPADKLVDVEIAQMVATHRASQNLVTYQWHGDDAADIDHRERAPARATGVYLLEPAALAALPPRTFAGVARDLIPRLLDQGAPVGGYQHRGYYNPLATFADYQAAQTHYLYSGWEQGRLRLNGTPPLAHPTVRARQVAPGIWSGKNNAIHPEAQLAPPLYIGDNCRIGRDVELGPGVVIGDHVVVDRGATISQSTILDHTYVGELVKIERRLVQHNLMIDAETGHCTRIPDTFLLARIRPDGMESTFRRVGDALLATFLLALLFPLLLLLAVLLRLASGRAFVPAVRQAGSDGRSPVTLWHLNTRRSSGRASWLGALVERMEWHRLPELWAVVQGKLALVGVKPLTPEEAKLVVEEWQQTRYEQPAGFTGLWYVQQAGKDDPPEMTLINDSYYAAVRTWREDLRLCYRTPGAWWRQRRGPHGVFRKS